MEAVRGGASRSAVPEVAASELAAQLVAPGVTTAMFFASVAYDLERPGEALDKRFEGVAARDRFETLEKVRASCGVALPAPAIGPGRADGTKPDALAQGHWFLSEAGPRRSSFAAKPSLRIIAEDVSRFPHGVRGTASSLAGMV